MPQVTNLCLWATGKTYFLCKLKFWASRISWLEMGSLQFFLENSPESPPKKIPPGINPDHHKKSFEQTKLQGLVDKNLLQYFIQSCMHHCCASFCRPNFVCRDYPSFSISLFDNKVVCDISTFFCKKIVRQKPLNNYFFCNKEN